MNKSYLKLLFRQYRAAFVFLILVETVFSLTPHLSPVYNSEGAEEAAYYINEGMTIGICLSVVIAAALPMILFSYIHRKSSVDLYFALPVSRSELLITGIAFAWMTAWGGFLVSSFAVYIRYAALLSPVSWFAKLLWAAVGLLAVTLTVTFVYTLGNNLFDGFVLVCAYGAIPLAVLWALSSFFSAMVAGDPSEGVDRMARCLSPMYLCYAGVAESAGVAGNPSETGTAVLYLVILLVFGAVSCFGLKKEFIDRKTERAGRISDGFLAYPLIIHIYLVLTMMCIVFTFYNMDQHGTEAVYLLILFVIYIIAMDVYRRGIRIRWQDILKFGVIFVCCYVLAFAGWRTEGFGLARSYSLNKGDALVYEYYAVVTREDIGAFPDEDYDWEKELSVSLDLRVPSDPSEWDDAQRQAVELLESHRKDIIAGFYQGSDYEQNSYIDANLQVYNVSPDKAAAAKAAEMEKLLSEVYITRNSYSYNIHEEKDAFTVEELKVLRNAEAVISLVDSDGNDYSGEIEGFPVGPAGGSN